VQTSNEHSPRALGQGNTLAWHPPSPLPRLFPHTQQYTSSPPDTTQGFPNPKAPSPAGAQSHCPLSTGWGSASPQTSSAWPDPVPGPLPHCLHPDIPQPSEHPLPTTPAALQQGRSPNSPTLGYLTPRTPPAPLTPPHTAAQSWVHPPVWARSSQAAHCEEGKGASGLPCYLLSKQRSCLSGPG